MSCTELACCSSPFHFPPHPQSKHKHPGGKKRQTAAIQKCKGGGGWGEEKILETAWEKRTHNANCEHQADANSNVGDETYICY